MVIAYGIALEIGWDKPFWAGFAVAMISLDTAGASLNKAAMRMLGTLLAAREDPQAELLVREYRHEIRQWRMLIQQQFRLWSQGLTEKVEMGVDLQARLQARMTKLEARIDEGQTDRGPRGQPRLGSRPGGWRHQLFSAAEHQPHLRVDPPRPAPPGAYFFHKLPEGVHLRVGSTASVLVMTWDTKGDGPIVAVPRALQ